MDSEFNHKIIVDNPNNIYWKQNNGRLFRHLGEDYLNLKFKNEVTYEDLAYLDYRSLNIDFDKRNIEYKRYYNIDGL